MLGTKYGAVSAPRRPLNSTDTAGLVNLGNSCFMNASLQCMFHIPELRLALLRGDHGSVCVVGPCGCTTCAMEKACDQVWNGSYASSPRDLFSALGRISSTLVPGRQEDAHEFVRHLVDAMQRDMARAQGIRIDKPFAVHLEVPGTLAHELFIGHTRSRVRCGNCAAVSDTEEPFEDISLSVVGAGGEVGSVEGALEGFAAREDLSGDNAYRCDACKRQCPATKQVTLHRTPPVLVLHLKRFSFASALASKRTHFVSYPPVLDIGRFYSGPVRPPAAPAQGPGGPHPPRPAAQTDGAHGVRYRLCGVVTHSGYSPRSGHYTCCVRVRKNRWLDKSDSFVRPITAAEAMRQQAYLVRGPLAPRADRGC